MVAYATQPTLHLDAVALAAPVAHLLGWDPRALPREHLLYCCDVATHQRVMHQLDEALAGLPLPLEGSSQSAVKDQGRSQAEYEELTLSRIQEDCCFSLPLDHEFGESMRPRELEHWKRAPGVLSGPTSAWGIPQTKQGRARA